MQKLKFTLLCFAIIWTSCKAQRIVPIDESIVSRIEPGKCYFSVKSTTANPEGIDRVFPFRFANHNDADIEYFRFEKGFILRVTEPTSKREFRKITEEDLKNIDWKRDKHTIEATPPIVEMVINNDKLLYDFRGIWEAGLSICFIEIPGTYKTVTTQQLRDKNFSIQYLKREKRKIEKIYVDQKPKNLKSNEWYFEEGYWSEFQKFHEYNVCGGNYFELVPRALKELGYPVKDDKTIDEDDKVALTDFNKKNGLSSGWDMPIETLRKLGVVPKSGTFKNLPFQIE